MSELITVDPSEFGLEETKAKELTAGLTTILTERGMLRDAYEDVLLLEVNAENIPTFKDLRLKIRDNRTKGIEKWHKVNKEFFLTGGRFVDAIKNRECAENERMEGQLLNAEKHFENIEKEKLRQVHLDRVALIIPYGYEIGSIDFSGMDANLFNTILTGAKKTHEDNLEAARLVEIARIEKEKADLAMRIENERLKEEAKEAERLARIEKSRADEQLAEANRKAEHERAKQELLAEIERDKAAKILADQKAAQDKVIAEERAKAELLAKEIIQNKVAGFKKRLLADGYEKTSESTFCKGLPGSGLVPCVVNVNKLKELTEDEFTQRLNEVNELINKKQAELQAKAPDKDKLRAYVESIISTMAFDLTTQEAAKVHGEITAKFVAFKEWAMKQVEAL